MDKLLFGIIYWVLGIIVLVVRCSLVDGNDVVYCMTVVNKFAGFVTLIMIFYNVCSDIRKKIQEKHKGLKGLKAVLFFSVLVLVGYWELINELYKKFPVDIMNDSITIVTLTIALTTSVVESFLKAIFYKG